MSDLLVLGEFARQIEGGDIDIVAQPIVDLARGHIVGYEALARFPTTEGLGVEGWFALAERSGLGPRLEAATLVKALSLRPDLPTNCFLTVNVSPAALVSRPVREALEGAGSLGGVVVELTEHQRIGDLTQVLAVLQAIRGAGAMVAIDDAGAGYAGLRHILEIRPDLLKIDRSLISGLDHDQTKRSLVSMLGTFADRADAWLLAEGLETPAELAAAMELGVPLGQGWALARAGPPWCELDDQATTFMRAHLERVVATSNETTAARTMEVLGWAHADDSDALTQRNSPVVILDHFRRPAGILDPADPASIDTPTLKVHADTDLTTVARRMLARPSHTRHRPAVVVDGAGRYLGVLRWERVFEHLIDHQTNTTS